MAYLLGASCRFVLTAIVCWPAGEHTHLWLQIYQYAFLRIAERACTDIDALQWGVWVRLGIAFHCGWHVHTAASYLPFCNEEPAIALWMQKLGITLVRQIWLMMQVACEHHDFRSVIPCCAGAVMYCCCKDEANNCFGTPARVNESTSMAIPF